VHRKFIDEAISSDEVADILIYLQQQRAWGRDSFRAMVEAKTQRFSGVRPAHRPARERLPEMT
jgi:putative transposase